MRGGGDSHLTGIVVGMQLVQIGEIDSALTLEFKEIALDSARGLNGRSSIVVEKLILLWILAGNRR